MTLPSDLNIPSFLTCLQIEPDLYPRLALTCEPEVTVLIVGDGQTLHRWGLVEGHPQALLQLH